ncbi:MAG: hypothetical protein WBM32_12720, partial [Crocosphaera sp.]
IIVNDYQHEGWDYYTFSSSLEWHSNLIKKAKEGKRLLILTAAQKPESKNGTMAIENRLNNEFNKLSEEWEMKQQHCVNLYQLAVTIFSCLSHELNVNLNLVKLFIQQLTSLFNSQLTQELSQELTQKLSQENKSQFNDESTSNFTEVDILRVDSETLTEKGHPACLGKRDLNALFKKYRIVVASPSIVSGISLDLEDHFDEVWALSTGAISPTNFVQFLWRLRANVPRFIYVNKISNIGLIGNGSTNPNHLMRSEKKKIKLTLASLREFDSLSMEDVDGWVDPICIKTWAKMGARINRQMKTYRNTVYALLDVQNHRRHDWSDSLDKEGRKEERETLTENRNQVRDEYLSDQVNAKDITHNTAKEIEEKAIKTKEEKAQLGKYNLNQKYGQVTQEIALADHLGLHPKLRLHYHLTMGRKFVEEKDTANLKTLLENNDGAAFIPDVNRILKINKVRVLEVLNVLSLVSKEREFVATDEDLIGRTKLAIHNTSEIKSIFGISICQPTVNPKTEEIILPTIKVIRQQLNIIGYDLERTNRRMIDGKRQYIYKLVDLLPSVTRQEIFNYWLAKDREYSLNFSETRDMEEELNQDRDKSMVNSENIEVVREKNEVARETVYDNSTSRTNEVARETVYDNSTSRTNEAVPSVRVGMEVINLTTSGIGKIISVSKKFSEVLVQFADHVISYNLSTFWEQMELTF